MKETCAQVQKKLYHSQANGMDKKGPPKQLIVNEVKI
jgi:hypothetical protein